MTIKRLSIFASMILLPAIADAVVQTDTAELRLFPDTLPDYSSRILSPPAEGKHVTLSLKECRQIALSDNPTIRVADMELQRADYSKRETRAALFPTIDFNGAYQRALELQTINMNMGGTSQKIKMGSENSWNFGFTATLPIIAPQLWKTLDISNIQILATAEQARASRLDLIDAVNRAYYALLLAKSTRKVMADNYNLAVYNAEIFRKRYLQGTATEYDTLRSVVQIRNVEPQLLQADISLKQARLQLKVLLNLPPECIIDANTTLEALRTEMYSHSSSGMSLSENTQLRSMDIQARILDETVQLKKMAWIPTLGASFSYSWNSLSDGNPFRNLSFNPYSVVGLQVSVPIFSGGSKYYGLKGAQLQRTELALQRENLVNTLNMQIEVALDDINREARQIDASASGMEQARKAYDIMQRSFELDAASYLDLRDSELAHTTAQLNYYQAIYNYLVSLSQLDLLLGRSVDSDMLK